MKGLARTDSKAVVLACFAVDGMFVLCVFTFLACAVLSYCILDYCLPMLDIDRWLLDNGCI